MSGQSTHLDPEVLAEFRAGLITGRRGAALAAHLAGCDRCTALDADLVEVSALLAAVPPTTLPADLAGRLDIVLAAEVAERSNHSERAVVSRPRPRRRNGWLAGWIGAGNRRFRLVAIRVLAPAAVVLAGLGYGLSQIGGSPATIAASAPAPVPSAFSAAGTATSQNPHNLPRTGPEEGGTSRVAVSDTNYLPGTLGRQVEAALRGSSHLPLATQAASQQLRACVLRLTGGIAPVLAQSAHYQGQPAVVIVASKTKGDLVLVVAPGWAAPGCSATSKDVLDTATLPPGI
ncbi:MAG: hypothetical protein ACRDPY_08400 [Streptosporangiaceae bacterium]